MMSLNQYLGLNKPIMFNHDENGMGIILNTSDIDKFDIMKKRIKGLVEDPFRITWQGNGKGHINFFECLSKNSWNLKLSETSD